MKIAGKEIKTKNREIIAIPREDGDIVFVAEGIQDMSEFFKLCPVPQPPEIFKRIDGVMEKVPNLRDKGYQHRVSKWAERKTQWMIIKSLEATPGGIEWETVDLTDPETWGNYESELRDAGFTDSEILRIVNGAIDANGMNDQRIQEAKARFLQDQQGCENGQDFQKEELTNTQSGEPVNEQDSKSNRLATKK